MLAIDDLNGLMTSDNYIESILGSLAENRINLQSLVDELGELGYLKNPDLGYKRQELIEYRKVENYLVKVLRDRGYKPYVLIDMLYNGYLYTNVELMCLNTKYFKNNNE